MKKFKRLLPIAFIVCMAFLLSGCIFGKNSYSITIAPSECGQVVANKTKATKDEIITLSHTTNVGYEFKYYIVNGKILQDENTFKMPEKNVTISAEFDLINYSITYAIDTYTTHSNPTNYNVETNTISLAPAYKSGYDFVGWFTESTYENQINQVSKGSTGTLNLYAKFNKLFEVNASNNSITSITNHAKSKSTLEIPQMIDGINITSVASNALNGATCSTIKFGTNIKTFNKDSFASCYGIENVYFFGELADWAKISFISSDNGDIKSNPLWSSTSPKVYLNNSLVGDTITFPTTITSVGQNAFYRWSFLSKVYYQGQLADWLKISFATKYSSPLFPIIGRTSQPKLFINNSLVTGNISIPSGINYIQPGALAGTQIETVTLSSSVRYIGECAFYNCPYVNMNMTNSSIAVIYDYAFYNCSSLKITLPENLVTLGNYAFANACTFSSATTSLIIPQYVTTIGECAFQNCTKLTNVSFGIRVETIPSQAFEGCTGLTSITLPYTLNTIEFAAFRNCSSLHTITVKKLSSTNFIKGAEDMFRNTALQNICFEDTEQKTLYASKTYWNQYTKYFKIAS